MASAGESQGQPRTMEPYYSVMKLLGERAEEFLLMLPVHSAKQGQPRGLDGAR